MSKYYCSINIKDRLWRNVQLWSISNIFILSINTIFLTKVRYLEIWFDPIVPQPQLYIYFQNNATGTILYIEVAMISLEATSWTTMVDWIVKIKCYVCGLNWKGLYVGFLWHLLKNCDVPNPRWSNWWRKNSHKWSLSAAVGN